MNSCELDFDKICRICMRTRRLTPIFGRKTEAGVSFVTSKDFSSVITHYAAVEVSKEDGLPLNICYGCISLLNTIIYFKNVCERSYKTLKNIYQMQSEASMNKSVNFSKVGPYRDAVIFNKEYIKSQTPTPLAEEINTHTEPVVPTLFVKFENHSNNGNNYSSHENDITSEDDSDINVKMLPVMKTDKVNFKSQSLIDSIRVNKRPRRLIGSKQKQKELTHIQRNARIREIATLRKDRLLKNMILQINTTKRKKMNPEVSQKLKAMFRVVKNGVLIPGTKKAKVTNLVQCRECSAVLQQCSMSGHFQKHTGYKYVCEHCGNRFSSQKVMEQHCMARHGKEKTFACKTCGYRTAYKSEFTVHQRSHTGERPFTCDICGRGFHRRQCLIKHITLHSHLRPFQCEYCPKTFRNKNDIPGHINSLHHRRYVYKCTECDATYAKLSSVRKHLVALHRVPRERQGKVPRIHLT